MLKFLASFEAPLSLKDSEGNTPLYYAKQQRSGVMKMALEELLEKAEASKVSKREKNFVVVSQPSLDA